jgi:hypothetical protein
MAQPMIIASAQFRSAPVVATTSALPVGDFERILRRESTRRREPSVATVLWSTVVVVLVVSWATISHTWMSFPYDMIFTVMHRETGSVRIWLVTKEGEWKDAPLEHQLQPIEGKQMDYLHEMNQRYYDDDKEKIDDDDDDDENDSNQDLEEDIHLSAGTRNSYSPAVNEL